MIAHKSFTGTIIEAEQNGTLTNMHGSFPYRKGSKIFKNLNGHLELVTDEYIERNFIEVEPKKEVKVNLDEIAEAYRQDWVDGEEDYIFDIEG